MSSHQEAYNKTYRFIAEAETRFDFIAANTLIDLFKAHFSEYSGMHRNLIDLYSDQWREKFPEPKVEKKTA